MQKQVKLMKPKEETFGSDLGTPKKNKEPSSGQHLRYHSMLGVQNQALFHELFNQMCNFLEETTGEDETDQMVLSITSVLLR